MSLTLDSERKKKLHIVVILQGLGWPMRPLLSAGHKKNKNVRKKIRITKFIYLLIMPKYWGKQIFTHGRFSEVGEKKREKRKED